MQNAELIRIHVNESCEYACCVFLYKIHCKFINMLELMMSVASFIKKTKAHGSNPGRRCVLEPCAKDVFRLSALDYA